MPTSFVCTLFTGAVADALILNAGYALAACQVAASPMEGVSMAREVHGQGKAIKTLDAWAAVSQRCAVAEKQVLSAKVAAA